MIKAELGAMFKRIALMAKDCSDYAVGQAVIELVETAATAIVDRPMPLSAAERMDRAAEVEKAIEDRINRSSLNARSEQVIANSADYSSAIAGEGPFTSNSTVREVLDGRPFNAKS